jgi:hypothetical protein
MKYYKCLNKSHSSPFVPNFKYPKKGVWTPKVKNLIRCKSGYHVCEKKDLPEWLDHEIWEVEGKGQFQYWDNKGAFQQIRLVRKFNWDSRLMRLFAADCAEHILKHFIAKYPDDDRPIKSIQAARDYANGLITAVDTGTAALAATLAAASAADTAARDAVDTYSAHVSAYYAAYAAAYAATCATATACASAAAHAAYDATCAYNNASASEKKWQGKRLFEYLEGKRG